MALGLALLLLLCGCRLGFHGSGAPGVFWDDADSHAEALDAEAAVADEAEQPPPPGLDWPAFRGPQRDGLARGAIRQDWPEGGPPVLWRRPIGAGHASVVVSGSRLVAIGQRDEQEVVACYRISDGRELWTRGWDGRFDGALGGLGPRATPTIAGERVLALGASGRLVCLDLANGQLRWSRDILADADASNKQWGLASSPLVVDGLVITNPGGEGKAVAAYRLEDGSLAWQSGDIGASYASPMVATLDGVRQLLIFGGEAFAGFDLEGNLLWSVPWPTHYGINVTQPVVVNESEVIVASGYGRGAGRLRLFAPRAAGDAWQASWIWKKRHWKPKFSSGVVVGDHLYGLTTGRLICIDLASGAHVWRGEKVGYGQLIAAGRTLFVSCEDGDLLMARATPEGCQILGRIELLERRTWNTPALARGRLFMVGDRELVCLDVRAD